MTPSQISSLQELAKKEGNLEIDIENYRKVNLNQSYFVGGFEFQVLKLQIVMEAMAMDKVRSGTIGVKLNF